MLSGLGKLFGAQNTQKSRFIKIWENRRNIEFQEKNFSGAVSFQVGDEDVQVKGRHNYNGQLAEFTENVLDWPCIKSFLK